ncbi:MAG: GntR family transcriptional regulator, partial [Oscillospiraceae bacterium]
MNINISNLSQKPIYEQITLQIKQEIISGALKENEMLPSIRSLAKDLRISVITTKRAYEELEREGFIVQVAGKGSFVGIKNDKTIQNDAVKKISEHMQEIANIAKVSGINEEKIKEIILEELTEINDKYKDERRTSIETVTGEVDIEDLIPVEDCVLTLTHYGYVKRQCVDVYKTQHRGGRGISGMTRREEDFVENLFVCSTH